MAFDAGMLSCMTHEILSLSRGARVEKVYQPDRDEIHIQIRSLVGGKRLLINAGSNNPRIGFTEIAKENPQNPPMFCVLLRKHLQGAKILSVTQPGLERVVIISMEHLDEMGDVCVRNLHFELMGKYSNLILCDSNDVIIDSLKHVSGMMSSVREVLPGRAYFIPQTLEKKDALNTGYAEFVSAFAEAGQPAYKRIYSAYTGISPFMAQEVCNRAGVDDRIMSNALDNTQTEALYRSFSLLIEEVKSGKFVPTIVYENHKVREFAVTSLTSYTKEQKVYF